MGYRWQRNKQHISAACQNRDWQHVSKRKTVIKDVLVNHSYQKKGIIHSKENTDFIQECCQKGEATLRT